MARLSFVPALVSHAQMLASVAAGFG